MKVIFLDIDGVLNTRRGWSNRPDDWTRDQPGEFYKPIQTMLEDWLIRHPDVQIVLSSTWRMTKDPIERPFGWKFRIRKESPIILDRIFSVTPRSKNGRRGEEIESWLAEHSNLDIAEWCIIDDDDYDILDSQMSNMVKTKTQIGLTQAHLRKVEEILWKH